MLVIDAHIHLFSTEARCRSLNWLYEGHRLDRQHTFRQYIESNTPAQHAVFVECDTNPGEDYAAIMDEIADASQYPEIKAIVAWAPMDQVDGKFSEFMQRLHKADHRNIIRGIRFLLQDKPAGFGLSDIFLNNLRTLGHEGLLFEIGINVHEHGLSQLSDAEKLISSCPQTTFIIDHLGKPDLSDPPEYSWTTAMRQIAVNRNVFIKLSGCFTELPTGSHMPHSILIQHVMCIYEIFTPDRIIYGSDWPVIQLSAARETIDTTPRGWYNFLLDTFLNFGVMSDDLAKIFRLNAMRVYGIK